MKVERLKIALRALESAMDVSTFAEWPREGDIFLGAALVHLVQSVEPGENPGRMTLGGASFISLCRTLLSAIDCSHDAMQLNGRRHEQRRGEFVSRVGHVQRLLRWEVYRQQS